jgi:transposase
VGELTESLPGDIDALRTLLRSTLADAMRPAPNAITPSSRSSRLRHPLKELQRARFGRSSERLDPDQLQLALEEVEQALAQAESEIEKRAALRSRAAKPRSDERQSLPAHSPRIEVVITPEDTACRCCKGPMHVIGEETSERLGVIPAQYRVLVTRRLKYACRACANAIVQPSASERLIRGGLPTEAMVAHVLVSKYAWHLPLYRQAPGQLLYRCSNVYFKCPSTKKRERPIEATPAAAVSAMVSGPRTGELAACAANTDRSEP